MCRTVSNPSLKASGARQNDIGVCFDSLPAFLDYAVAAPHSQRFADSEDGDRFDACQLSARHGDIKRVAASDKLMAELESLTQFATSKMITVADVAGGYVNVPAFLAGTPLCMMRRKRIRQEQAPLNIVIDLGARAGISSATLAARGAAVLALVRILSAIRPVSLYVGHSNSPESAQSHIRASGIAVRLDTAPIDLARAAYVMCAAGFLRTLLFTGTARATGANHYDSLPFPYHNQTFYNENIHAFWHRIVSVAGQETMVVSSLRRDEDIAKFANPAAWLTQMVEKYGAPLIDQ